MAAVGDSSSVFDEDGLNIESRPVPGYPDMEYMPFGFDDMLPFRLLDTVGKDEVISQNLFFNILTAYGSGIRYMDTATGRPSADPEIRKFLLSNSVNEFFLEQCTDMKHFFFSVAVLILNRARSKIVEIRHKDACYCRFEKADRSGRIRHVFFANWRKPSSLERKDVEMLTLLDEKNPLGDLEALLGLAPGRDGETRLRTNEFKFAVVMRFPTPGQRY